MKKIITSILLASILAFFLFIYTSQPLKIEGHSTFDDGHTQVVVYELHNDGFTKVHIKDVAVNGRSDSDIVQLGVSYDTSQFVQFLSDNPNIMFMEFDQEPIFPKVSPKDIKAIIEKNEMTPIHYGIKVEQPEHLIESLTIQYRYFGFPVTKTYKVRD
ncbi:hypothetical protein [Alkalihalobacterium bogoriense]|uniref:hypothetical protein n=1 Tax=Alkalihalobacterium bogoriense TaxID=246272 RepID=UPI000479EFBA|nr:hypothetical protein [Alkalihalobacterium bogoriense]